MNAPHPPSGIFAAAVTPLKNDFSLDLPAVLPLLDFLARRGCHGALLFGTTGEGPSFSPAERRSLWAEARHIREVHPDFGLLAGAGTPSLEETIDLARMAFELEFDSVVVLPPYFFRKASDDGLFAWFSQVINRAVPPGRTLLGYHIPGMSGVPLSLDLLARLKDRYPDRFAGIKDSSGDPDHARHLGARFGSSLVVLNGNDRLLPLALENHAAGAITALANLLSPDLRQVWDAYQSGGPAPEATARLGAARLWLDRHPPAPPLLKAFLARQHGLPRWTVRPPLLPLPADLEEQAAAEMALALLAHG